MLVFSGDDVSVVRFGIHWEVVVKACKEQVGIKIKGGWRAVWASGCTFESCSRSRGVIGIPAAISEPTEVVDVYNVGSRSDSELESCDFRKVLHRDSRWGCWSERDEPREGNAVVCGGWI